MLGRLQKRIDDVRVAATAEGLAEHSLSRIAKAERVLPKMAQTIDFVSGYVRQQIDRLGLTGKESYQIHVREYRLGLVNNLDVLQAQNTMQDIKHNLDRALLDAKLSYIDVGLSMGEKQ